MEVDDKKRHRNDKKKIKNDNTKKNGNICSTIHLFTWNRIALSMFPIFSMTTDVLNHTHT